ncbi:hypothetical protein NA57DRAFT_74524 [Rhizodiscina lignyota]|uniref:Uncharacterized protein n=1 Tax=Rhizodiscina lignyota TaxID=1504668 RepID=A0A9P4IJQ9_9PEZI|nr:hypothetical protein NA57DRAFT_74524 [Rhizodiscina lignyota]
MKLLVCLFAIALTIITVAAAPVANKARRDEVQSERASERDTSEEWKVPYDGDLSSDELDELIAILPAQQHKGKKGIKLCWSDAKVDKPIDFLKMWEEKGAKLCFDYR